jgi:aminomethyltransferase
VEEFSGIDDEYRAARESVVVVDRSDRAFIRVTGKDRLSFLQNMLSNDVKRLQTGEGVWAALLTRKGTLISDLVVYQLGDALLLEMEPEGLSPSMESLTRYLVSEDVTLVDVTGDEALFSVEGPRAAKLLSQVLVDLSETRLAELGVHHFISNRDEERDLRVSAARHGPGTAFDVAVPAQQAAELLVSLLDAGRPQGLRPVGWQVQEIRRIEAGIPLLGADMDASHLPLEAGLDDAISFNKGCYIGQEYVVRLAHRGHLNRKLTGLAFSGQTVPNAGDEIRASHDESARAAGRVTSAAFSPSLAQPIAMGYVPSALLQPGTVVTVLSGDRALSARVTELPFIE